MHIFYTIVSKKILQMTLTQKKECDSEFSLSFSLRGILCVASIRDSLPSSRYIFTPFLYSCLLLPGIIRIE